MQTLSGTEKKGHHAHSCQLAYVYSGLESAGSGGAELSYTLKKIRGTRRQGFTPHGWDCKEAPHNQRWGHRIGLRGRAWYLSTSQRKSARSGTASCLEVRLAHWLTGRVRHRRQALKGLCGEQALARVATNKWWDRSGLLSCGLTHYRTLGPGCLARLWDWTAPALCSG